MADFTVIVASGAQVQDWLDPPTALQPSRLNPRPGYPLKRWVGARGTAVVLKAVVGGVLAPLDAALGGRLFTPWAVEAPPTATPFVGFSSPLAQSSVVIVTCVFPGHYTIGVRRLDGGAEHVPLDIA